MSGGEAGGDADGDSGTATDPVALFERLESQQLSDGLPVVPPTDERVERHLATVDREPDAAVTELPTSFAPLSVASLARCAVMAGCRPSYFPVVLAALAATDEWENLEAALATTSGFCPLIVVNGPIRDELDVNCDTGLFAPGYRANATVGRAVSLALLTVGGVYPGSGTMATQAHPGRFTYCVGENEAASGWPPLHADPGGLDPETSAVTVTTAHSPILVDEGPDDDPDAADILDSFVRIASATAVGPARREGQILFVLGRDHAGRLADEYTKAEERAYFREHCESPADGSRLLAAPEDAVVVVAGSIGNYSSVIHTMASAGLPAITRPIPGQWPGLPGTAGTVGAVVRPHRRTPTRAVKAEPPPAPAWTSSRPAAGLPATGSTGRRWSTWPETC